MCVAAIGLMAGLASTIVQGVTESNSANYNAEMAKRESERVRQLGAVEEAAQRRQHDFSMGQQIVDMAAAGRSTGDGTALELAYQSKMESELQLLGIRAGYQMKAENKDAERGLYKLQGKQALIGAGFGAASRILNSPSFHPALG